MKSKNSVLKSMGMLLFMGSTLVVVGICMGGVKLVQGGLYILNGKTRQAQ